MKTAKTILASLMMLSAILPAFAQNNTRGYYKDIFMDSGILLYPDGVPYILEVK